MQSYTKMFFLTLRLLMTTLKSQINHFSSENTRGKMAVALFLLNRQRQRQRRQQIPRLFRDRTNPLDCTWLILRLFLTIDLIGKAFMINSLVEQELLTLPEHPSSPPVFSGVRVTRSLVLYVCFVDRCLSFCTLSFGHCVVCSSSIYGFWLPLWYLQTLLSK